MFHLFQHRWGHYLLLLATWAVLCLPNLGGPSLWEVDEGHNSAAAQEMYESGNWIVPTFNSRLRDDKPALLYWLQMLAYECLGVNEFAARLPSALAGLLTILATYELGRRMFGSSVGLLGGLILASCLAFCAAAHFANPDALLVLFTVLTLLFFWRDNEHDHALRYIFGTVASGFAVLAKGPVGLVLPLSVIGLFLLWQRQLRKLLDLRMFWACLAFAAFVAPWYVWVSLETKGEWLFGFLGKHNFGRFKATMENHGGPFYLYYLLVFLVGLAPWSIFFGLTIWHALRKPAHVAGTPEPAPLPKPLPGLPVEVRFLLCWIVVYLVFFSLSATKLPNYILPIYPPMVLLTARFLDHWRRGQVDLPRWAIPSALVCLALIGLSVAGGILVVSGRIEGKLMHGRIFPGLETVMPAALLLVAGAVVGWWCLRRQHRAGLIGAVAFSSVLFLASLAAWGTPIISSYRAPRSLVAALPADQLQRDVRVGCFDFYQPSLVFYCQREVQRLEINETDLRKFLGRPLPSYLFLRAATWEAIQAQGIAAGRVVGRHYDLYDNQEIVLVANMEALKD
jgi:4-amino-4-deoxy-L-arabinose transferase-like glycosyltransferase